MFTGEYRHTVDDKGRLAVPARFRAQLDAGAVVARWLDTCLAIFPRPAWEELATRVAALPITDGNARTFQRYVFAGAFEAELDRRWVRIFRDCALDPARVAAARHVALATLRGLAIRMIYRRDRTRWAAELALLQEMLTQVLTRPATGPGIAAE